MKQIKDVDEYNISLLGDAYELYSNAEKAVLENGLTIFENGSTKVNPACSIMIRQQGVILQMLKEYGISAKARRVMIGKQEDELNEDSPLSQFLEMAKDDEI